MKKTQFNDEVSDEELFQAFRESLSSDEECWQTVQEAQQAFREFRQEIVLEEMKKEADERGNDPYYDSYAA
jgi:hypothetical protein